jgi:hypothetical protein
MLAAMPGMAPAGTGIDRFTRDLRFGSRATICGGKRRIADVGPTRRLALFHRQTAGDAHGDRSPGRQGCVLPAQRFAGRWPTHTTHRALAAIAGAPLEYLKRAEPPRPASCVHLRRRNRG